MKIFQISSERAGWSGGAEQMMLLAKGIRSRGHEVFASCVKGSPLEKRLVENNFNVLALPMWNDGDVYSAWKIAQFCKKNRIEIVHAMHARAHGLALVASFFVKIPLVVTRRVSFNLNRNLYSGFKYRSERIHKFICVSHAVKRELLDFGVPEHKLEVIYSGVDTKRFYPRGKERAIMERYKIPAEIPVVGCIANFSKWKGQEVFLRAAKIIRDKSKRVHFLIAGSGNDREPVLSWVRELGLEGAVTLIGFVEDVPQVMSVLDLFVSPSVGAEGLSGTLREALAMGLPAVATDVGGNREILKNNENGLLVPPSDPSAIAEAVLSLLSDRERALEMGRRARIEVEKNFSVEKMVERTEEVYHSVIKK